MQANATIYASYSIYLKCCRRVFQWGLAYYPFCFNSILAKRIHPELEPKGTSKNKNWQGREDESQSDAKIFKTISEGERVFARSEAPK
jgi:hypothetical protein